MPEGEKYGACLRLSLHIVLPGAAQQDPKFSRRGQAQVQMSLAPPKAHVPFIMPPLASCFQEVSKTPSASSGTCCHCGYSYNTYDVLCRMEGNIVLMQQHLRELLLHHPKAGRTQRAKKKRKVEDTEEEESIFSICLESHGSQGGSGRESGGIAPQ